MSTTNGILTPPSLPAAPASLSPVKRKRLDNEPAPLTNGNSGVASTPLKGKLRNGASRSLPLIVEDIVSVLRSYDTQPSILDNAIVSATARSSSGESESKRTKLSPSSGSSSISELARSGSYKSLEALEHDVEIAAANVMPDLATSQRTAVQMSLDDIKLQTKVLAFQKLASDLIAREKERAPDSEPSEGAVTKSTEDVENEEEQDVQVKEGDFPEGRTVLTLYGSAQGPKQLFSSLQKPTRVSGEHTLSGLDTAPQVLLPLREATLPNIISTSEIFPSGDEDLHDQSKPRTIGQVCKPPGHLAQLSPPKHAKPLTTRGNTVTFVPQDVLQKPSRAGAHMFANQNLATGHWLGYGGVDKPKDPTSPTAKQKSRQRALSTGEAQLPPSEATLVAVQQAKEDALFRSVYSSFAPSRDDSTTIVPEEAKNKVWWQKVGEKRFAETFPIDPALVEPEKPAEAEANGTTDEAEEFRKMVENFEDYEEKPFGETEETEEEKSTTEILKEISELIEILASHQRNRNASLATNPRTPIIQNASLATLAGSPSTPSSEEIDVYQILKSQLSLMISQLPPYAVAKLNGDQLEELNISRTILIETHDSAGVLEDDHIPRVSKASVTPAATPSLSRMASSGSTHFPASNSQYNRPAPSMHTSAARPVPATPGYFPQQQPALRSPSVHYQRQPSIPGPHFQTPGATYAASTPRQNYPNAPAYGQPTPRASYSQPAPSSYYSQRPAQPVYGTANPQYYQTPQTQHQNRYPQAAQPPAQNGYYQRQPSVGSYGYGAAPSPLPRTESPMKTNPPITQQSYPGPRPAYGAPTSNGQMRSTYYPPSMPQTSQYGGAQPSTPTTVGTPGYNQQMMMDRQQQQAAAQSQARIAAQNSFRQGSGTPQPPPNPQYGNQQQPQQPQQQQQQQQQQQVNGAPMVA
ncbi:hypothetical protein B0J11DRAFT_8362 [Dendryphion nanum]|uniref:Uncharacterized protein n=1 Tax=Dendryphion nanum TaxID=256645 RepID=A0A9P9EH49_9PLEO|nr:hypothetical protein B0J11DRAFT_8362 [Dendryphion nanum]